MKQPELLRSLTRAFTRELPFSLGWRNMLILGTGLGLMAVAVTLLLEPFGTDQYQAPFRTLRLSGYALCYVVPFMLFHGFDRALYRWQGRRWRVYNELISRPLLILAVISANWWYNVTIINEIQPTMSGWAYFVTHFSLPFIVVLLPPAALTAYVLARRWPEPPPGARRPITFRGRNHGEILTLLPDDFIYAEAQQNYVAIHYRHDNRHDNRLVCRWLRTTLSDLGEQLPDAVRIHRSYLVNPRHVTDVWGNARKRRVALTCLDEPLPASPRFDPATVTSSAKPPNDENCWTSGGTNSSRETGA